MQVLLTHPALMHCVAFYLNAFHTVTITMTGISPEHPAFYVFPKTC